MQVDNTPRGKRGGHRGVRLHTPLQESRPLNFGCRGCSPISQNSCFSYFLPLRHWYRWKSKSEVSKSFIISHRGEADHRRELCSLEPFPSPSRAPRPWVRLASTWALVQISARGLSSRWVQTHKQGLGWMLIPHRPPPPNGGGAPYASQAVLAHVLVPSASAEGCAAFPVHYAYKSIFAVGS